MSKSKIAVIEDNEDVRENLVELLELTGFSVQSAPDGRKGIEMVREFLPDLILCDVMMPELDGYGVIHILSKEEKTAKIPFIFLTAKADKIDFRKGMSLGADDYITKPYDDTDLLNAIETRLKKATNNKEVKSSLPSISFEDLLKNAPEVRLKPKDKLYLEGDFSKSVYYIKKGRFKLYRTDTYGKDFITNIVEKENIIGNLPVVDSSVQNETAEALDDSEVQVIRHEDFIKALETNTEISLKLIIKLAKNLSDQEHRLLTLAYASLRERVADRLYKLTEKDAELNLTRIDLANSIGAAPESLIRMLSELKDEGIIEMNSKSIKVLDRSKLKSISG